jgi:hypothetical protein
VTHDELEALRPATGRILNCGRDSGGLVTNQLTLSPETERRGGDQLTLPPETERRGDQPTLIT